MNEKILIKSERYKIYKICIISIVLSIAYFLISLFINMSVYIEQFNRYVAEGLSDWISQDYAWQYALDGTFRNSGRRDAIIVPTILLFVFGILVFLWLRSYELTVTDKRVYGKVAFGKRVDLPVDSVSATSTIGLLHGVSVSTSSGKISFLVIKNSTEIYETINKLLINRQNEKASSVSTTIVQNSDEADMIKKYKDLLDTGVITQEEFDAKKKQLLGL